MLRCAVVAAVVATATAGARDAWQASLQSSKRDRPPPRSPIWDKSFRCVINSQNATNNAYAVVLGQQLQALVRLIAQGLTKAQRTSIGALVVLDVHAKDVVSGYVERKVPAKFKR